MLLLYQQYTTQSSACQVRKDGKAVGGIELGLQSIAEKAIFGRAPTCDVPVEHLSISRQHAVMSTDTAGNLYLMDMGSGEYAVALVWNNLGALTASCDPGKTHDRSVLVESDMAGT